ncbi:MAG: sulfatase [Planctomycetota bacterium]
MKRRGFLKTTGLGAAALALPLATRRAMAAPARPNFLFILVDDLGWRDVGMNGCEFYETPNVDRLARGGMRFTDAYAACPVCSPTRASIMTGKYPARLGITNWIPGHDPKNRKLLAPRNVNDLPLEEHTLAETFRDAGYATFYAGKWHLGGKGFHPDKQGFEVNVGGNSSGSPRGGYFCPYKNPELPDGPEGEYLTDRLGAETAKFIEANRDRPFLACLSFYTVHTPLQPKPEYVAKYKRKLETMPGTDGKATRREGDGVTRIRQDNAVFAGMVHSMDENVGQVLRKLEKLGLASTTVVIFMSDNGGLSTLKRAGPTSNEPLRAGKGWLYEGGIREPMVVRWPGVTKPGSVCSVPVTSTDFYPTMLEMAGLDARPEQHMDGVSIVPLLRGGKSLAREAVYWHFPHYHGSRSLPAGAVRAGDWKLIEFFEDMRVELYDLGEDIGERNDLAATEPGKVDELRRMLHEWRGSVGAKMPRANPAPGSGGRRRKRGGGAETRQMTVP